MVEPYFLPANGSSTNAQTQHSWQNEHIFAKTERNDHTHSDDDDDVQFISEIKPGLTRPANTVDLSKSIFDLLNDQTVNDVQLNGNSTDNIPIALDNNDVHSLPNYHTHRTTTSQPENGVSIAVANPFTQTLPQITVANFAKENVCSNGSNGSNATNGIFNGEDWLNNVNASNHFFDVTEQLPQTTLAAITPATSTANYWNWNQTLPATNNPQPGPSTSNFDWHLPYADVNGSSSCNAASTTNPTDNKPKMNNQILNNFTSPLPFVPQHNQPGPSRLAHLQSQQIEIPSPLQQANLPTPLPFVPQQNQPGPSRLAHQLGQQVPISEYAPPPLQQPRLPTPFVPQQNHLPPHNTFILPTPSPLVHNQPGPKATSTITSNDWNWEDIYGVIKLPNQTQSATNDPTTPNYDWHLPFLNVSDNNAAMAQNATDNKPRMLDQINKKFTLPTPLPFVPQQNQPGPSRLAHQLGQQIEITPPAQQARLLTPLPFVPQQNQPGPTVMANQLSQQIEIQKHVAQVPQQARLATPLPFVPQQNQPGPSRLAYQLGNQIEIPPQPQQEKLPTPLPFVPLQNQQGPSMLLAHPPSQQIEIPEHVPQLPQQARLETPLPFVPQQNQPGPSRLAHLLGQQIPPPPQPAKLPTPLPFIPQEIQSSRMAQQIILKRKREQLEKQLKQITMQQKIFDDIGRICRQEENHAFPPYGNGMDLAQNHTPVSVNIKRKHTDVMPINGVRNTKQYETLVEMGFLKKDIETALHICNLDLYETIEYLSEPKRQKQNQDTPNQFNAEIPNQIKQTHEEPKEANAELIKKPANLYEELLFLEETGGIVKSIESFDCEICMETIEMKDGMILRNCLHRYCKDCLNGTIVHSDEIEIKCPYVSCEEMLQDREIRAVLSQEEYDKYLMKCVRVAQVTITGTILCNLPDCDGWCICEDDVNEFKCPQCKNTNCIQCKAIHPGRNCREYQDDLAAGDANGVNSGQRRSEQAIQELIDKNEAMKCFKCGILIMKRDGCDYIQCVMCKGDICWATRGPRYGPGGKGDLSGGCGCTVQKRCHKDCRGCH